MGRETDDKYKKPMIIMLWRTLFCTTAVFITLVLFLFTGEGRTAAPIIANPILYTADIEPVQRRKGELIPLSDIGCYMCGLDDMNLYALAKVNVLCDIEIPKTMPLYKYRQVKGAERLNELFDVIFSLNLVEDESWAYKVNYGNMFYFDERTDGMYQTFLYSTPKTGRFHFYQNEPDSKSFLDKFNQYDAKEIIPMLQEKAESIAKQFEFITGPTELLGHKIQSEYIYVSVDGEDWISEIDVYNFIFVKEREARDLNPTERYALENGDGLQIAMRADGMVVEFSNDITIAKKCRVSDIAMNTNEYFIEFLQDYGFSNAKNDVMNITRFEIVYNTKGYYQIPDFYYEYYYDSNPLEIISGTFCGYSETLP
jgi:hypothetical protein